MILSLYARGMTTRDIQAHLAEVTWPRAIVQTCVILIRAPVKYVS